MKGSLLIVAVLLAGCYGLPTTPKAPSDCGFPEGTHFVFIGTISAAALGLPNGNGQVGKWWVSSERLPWVGHGPPGHPIAPPSPKACGVFDDGSMTLQSLPNDWHPRFNAVAS